MASAAPSLLPGQSPPISIITSTDKTGLIIIVTALGLAFGLISIFIRAYVRHEFSPKLVAWDDAIIGVALLVSIIQNALVFYEANRGLGKTRDDISPANLVKIQKVVYADDIFYIISVWLSKVSVALLYLRLSPKYSHVRVSKINMLLALVTGIVSIFIVCLRCDLSHPWININADNAQCSGLFVRWQVVAAFDISLEILLFATSVFLVHSLQMSVYKKLVVIFAFGLRLPVIVPTVFRLHYLSEALDSSDPTLEAVYTVMCKQIEIAYAIVAATIPCLRPFMTATATHYGAPAEGHKTKLGTSKGSGYGRTPTKLTSFTSKLRSRALPEKNTDSLPPSTGADDVFGRQDRYRTAVSSTPRDQDAGSMESGDSQQMIILKNVTYTIEDGVTTERARDRIRDGPRAL